MSINEIVAMTLGTGITEMALTLVLQWLWPLGHSRDSRFCRQLLYNNLRLFEIMNNLKILKAVIIEFKIAHCSILAFAVVLVILQSKQNRHGMKLFNINIPFWDLLFPADNHYSFIWVFSPSIWSTGFILQINSLNTTRES